MNRNIEIKARLRDLAATEARVAQLATSECVVLRQSDTFFNCPNGRLKLRVFPDGLGELIFYQRSDHTDAKVSNYLIYRTNDPEQLTRTLALSNGIVGEVKKVRHLYLIGQTRVHLDRVEGLGDFLELEVVLTPEQTVEEGQAIAANLMKLIDIREEDLIAGAYLDLLMAQNHIA